MLLRLGNKQMELGQLQHAMKKNEKERKLLILTMEIGTVLTESMQIVVAILLAMDGTTILP